MTEESKHYVEGVLRRDKLIITSEGHEVATISDPEDLDIDDWTFIVYTGGVMQDAVMTIKLSGYEVVKARWNLVVGGMGDVIPIEKEL